MFTGTVFGKKYIHDSGFSNLEQLELFFVDMDYNLVAKRVLEYLSEEGVFYVSEPWPNKKVRLYVKPSERIALINAIELWEAKVTF